MVSSAWPGPVTAPCIPGPGDRTVKVWRSADGKWRDGKLANTLQGHGHRVNALALASAFVCRTGPFEAQKPFKGTTFNDVVSTAKQRYGAFVDANGGSATCERLVSGSDDATLLFWTSLKAGAAKTKPKARLTGHQQPVNSILFSPDARKFASASFDKKIKLWHGRTGAFLATLAGHVGAVYALAWAPDSRLVVSASKDSTLKVWSAADDGVPGSEAKNVTTKTRKFAAALGTLPGHLDEVFCVDASRHCGAAAVGVQGSGRVSVGSGWCRLTGDDKSAVHRARRRPRPWAHGGLAHAPVLSSYFLVLILNCPVGRRGRGCLHNRAASLRTEETGTIL